MKCTDMFNCSLTCYCRPHCEQWFHPQSRSIHHTRSWRSRLRLCSGRDTECTMCPHTERKICVCHSSHIFAYNARTNCYAQNLVILRTVIWWKFLTSMSYSLVAWYQRYYCNLKFSWCNEDSSCLLGCDVVGYKLFRRPCCLYLKRMASQLRRQLERGYVATTKLRKVY
jgi:hypothetical protein